MSTPTENKDSKRFKTLVAIQENGGSSDFDQYLFFARRKTKTGIAAYRKALDQYSKSHGV